MQHRPRLHGGVVDVAGGHVERAQRGQPRGGHQRGAADAEAACQAQRRQRRQAAQQRRQARVRQPPAVIQVLRMRAPHSLVQGGAGRRLRHRAGPLPSDHIGVRPCWCEGAAMAGDRRPRSRAGGAPGAPGAAGPAAAPPARRRPHCSSRSGAAWLACRPARAPRPPRPRPPARPATHPPGASATSPARAAPGGRQRRRPGPGFRARAAQQGGQASAIEPQCCRTLHSPNACRPSIPQQKAGHRGRDRACRQSHRLSAVRQAKPPRAGARAAATASSVAPVPTCAAPVGSQSKQRLRGVYGRAAAPAQHMRLSDGPPARQARTTAVVGTRSDTLAPCPGVPTDRALLGQR